MHRMRRSKLAESRLSLKVLPFCKQPLRDVLMIMRDSGMRNQKEVFTMRWEHVDWANNRYFVYDSKSPKGRRFVPVSPRVRLALLARYSEQKEGWVFPSKRARCGHLTTMAKQFEKPGRTQDCKGSGSLLRTSWLRNGDVPGNQKPVRGHECHGTHGREHDDEVPAPEHR